jgi:hypothetical protein
MLTAKVDVSAFLVCSLPSVGLYLLESWRVYRRHTSPTSHQFRRRTAELSESVFSIPLNINNRQSVLEGTRTGIQVSQIQQVIVEQDSLDAKDDKESLKYNAL